MIRANDPSLHSWIEISPTSDFSLQNLPFGIFSTATRDPRVGVAIGDYVLDLYAVSQQGLFDLLPVPDPTVFHRPYLNDFIALGKPVWRAVRDRVSELLRNDNGEIRDNDEIMHDCLVKLHEATMHLPVKISNFTSFDASLDHATNIGLLFRNQDNPLLPNWKHRPVGYHGRPSSVMVSGAPIYRPQGQFLEPGSTIPSFGASQELDFELQVGYITGKSTQNGRYVLADEADDYVFGMVLCNNWAARDIDRWEAGSNGSLSGKSFATTISPWVVMLDALEPFRVTGPVQDPPVLPYLHFSGNKHLDVKLKVYFQATDQEWRLISETSTRQFYWNLNQQLAHLTSNGRKLETGDFLSVGPISGPDPDSFGSLQELTWNGSKPLILPDGSTRQYLEDSDTILITGFAEKNGIRVGFGEVTNTVLASS